MHHVRGGLLRHGHGQRHAQCCWLRNVRGRFLFRRQLRKLHSVPGEHLLARGKRGRYLVRLVYAGLRWRCCERRHGGCIWLYRLRGRNVLGR
jgi:hypothetical protein